MYLPAKANPTRILSAILLFVFMLILGPGCKTIKVDRISYNEEKRIYEYPAAGNLVVPLRNNRGELISKDNFDDFLVELEQMKYRYPFEERLEQAHILKESDYKIASLYSAAALAIQHERFEEVAGKVDAIRKIYPDALMFSDCSFIEGYAQERMGNEQEARLKFNEFLNYSSHKYSKRFRGYKYADSADSLLVQQRNYAYRFISGNQPDAESDFFEPIVPKYYYNSLQPGYNFNDEGLVENSNGLIFFTIGTFSNQIVGGFQYYKNINKLFDINPGYFTSGDMRAASLAVPIQVYKAENNRLGVKISPFAHYSNFSTINLYGIDQEMDESVFSFGFKASAGYYLMQKLSLGAYYTYNYYNKNNPYYFKSQPLNMWWNNEYDVSLYYNISKGFSLKSGVKASDFVAGIYWNGWEMSYGIGKQEFIFRADLY